VDSIFYNSNYFNRIFSLNLLEPNLKNLNMEICNKENCSVVKNHQKLLKYLIEEHEVEIKRLQEEIHNQKILNTINNYYGNSYSTGIYY